MNRFVNQLNSFRVVAEKRGPDPRFIQNWVPFTQGYSKPNLVKIPSLQQKKIDFKDLHLIDLLVSAQCSPDPLFIQNWVPFTQFKDESDQVWTKSCHSYRKRNLKNLLNSPYWAPPLTPQTHCLYKISSPSPMDSSDQIWSKSAQLFMTSSDF